MTYKKSFKKINGNYENKIMKVVSYNFFICNEKLNNTFFRLWHVENVYWNGLILEKKFYYIRI